MKWASPKFASRKQLPWASSLFPLKGTERLVISAIKYAIQNKKPSVTLVHKGNIMKFTEGQFKAWGYEVAEREFGDKVWTWAQYDRIAADQGKDAAYKAQKDALDGGAILIKDVIADAFLQQILLRPKEYSVIATLNLNGDYISDALAAQVGGIGIAPGANINYNTGNCHLRSHPRHSAQICWFG